MKNCVLSGSFFYHKVIIFQEVGGIEHTTLASFLISANKFKTFSSRIEIQILEKINPLR